MHEKNAPQQEQERQIQFNIVLTSPHGCVRCFTFMVVRVTLHVNGTLLGPRKCVSVSQRG